MVLLTVSVHFVLKICI